MGPVGSVGNPRRPQRFVIRPMSRPLGIDFQKREVDLKAPGITIFKTPGGQFQGPGVGLFLSSRRAANVRVHKSYLQAYT